MLTGRFGVALAVSLVVLSLGASVEAANGGPAADLAARALAECEAGRRAEDRDQRKSHFDLGQQLGEQAIQADDGSADAHFALFCNLGELMRLDGESVTSVLGFRRMMAELDRTLQIDPSHTDALASKGTLLVRLPRLLGGDAVKGEAMLRQVLQQDPKAFSTRLTLAKTCEARGDREEALAFATRALQIAREQGRADKIAQAQAMLAELSR
jgi:hypothetical protein